MRPHALRSPVIGLHGERITLRPPRPVDAREYALLMKKSAATYRGWLPPFKGKSQYDEYLQRCRGDDFAGFLICRSEDGIILGNMNLFHITLRALRSGCVGYWVGAPHNRQGYATEALQLVLQFAFKQVKLHRVEANIQPHNVPSVALVKRAGFMCEGLSRRYLKIAGRWRDHERWTILAEEWRPPPVQSRAGGV